MNILIYYLTIGYSIALLAFLYTIIFRRKHVFPHFSRLKGMYARVLLLYLPLLWPVHLGRIIWDFAPRLWRKFF